MRSSDVVLTRGCQDRDGQPETFRSRESRSFAVPLKRAMRDTHSKHPVEPTDDGHEKAEDEQKHPKAVGPAIFGKQLKLGKRLSIGHGALRDGARIVGAINLLY
jgi:hypothetical protein